MKKLLFSLAAIAALSLSSCGGKTAEATTDETNVDSLAASFEEGINAATDSASVVDLIGKAEEAIKDLEAKGDAEAVKAYKWKIQELVEKNKEKLASMNVVSAIGEIANVESLANQAVDAAKADAETAKEDAKDAAKTAIENNDKVKEVKAAAEETQKKAEEVKKAANDVKTAAESASNAIKALKK